MRPELKQKTEIYLQTENCRSPDDPARRAAVHSFSFILGKGKSSAALPALNCCRFLKCIIFKTFTSYNIIVMRVCIFSNIFIKSFKNVLKTRLYIPPPFTLSFRSFIHSHLFCNISLLSLIHISEPTRH